MRLNRRCVSDGVSVASELEIGLDALLERRQPESFEARALDRGEGLAKIGECVAVPERQRLR